MVLDINPRRLRHHSLLDYLVPSMSSYQLVYVAVTRLAGLVVVLRWVPFERSVNVGDIVEKERNLSGLVTSPPHESLLKFERIMTNLKFAKIPALN
jgi:hypothetical protein